MARRVLLPLLLAVPLMLAAAATASARVGVVTISPAAGPAGTTISVAAAGFPKRRLATVRLGRLARTRVRVGRNGRFTATLTVPSGASGVLGLVSRTRGRRVVNAFRVSAAATTSEVASSRGQHLRWTVDAAGAVGLHGTGFRRRARIRIVWLGRSYSVRPNRRGRFTLGLPAGGGGAHRGTLRVGGVRLRFTAAGPGGPIPPGGDADAPPGPVITPPPPGSPPQAPANTTAPSISGRPQAGETLTANPGAWAGSLPMDFAYRWQRCNASGRNCNPIAGATGATYAPKTTDVGSTLRIAVTASNPAGSATGTSNATQVIQPAPVEAGLVALWHMDETSGSQMRDSARAHTGTLHNVATGQPGFLGTAYGFNGSSSYVSVPSAGDLNPGSQTITITIRMKTTKLPPPEDWDLIRKGVFSDPGEYKVEYYPSGQASCGFIGTSGSAEIRSGPKLNNGQWHTVQCVKTSSQIRLVVDGQTFSKSANIGSIGNSAALAIGARPDSEFFDGSLDEASVNVG